MIVCNGHVSTSENEDLRHCFTSSFTYLFLQTISSDGKKERFNAKLRAQILPLPLTSPILSGTSLLFCNLFNFF